MESTNQEENQAGVTSLEGAGQSHPEPVNRSAELPVNPEQNQITQCIEIESCSVAPPHSINPATESNEEKTVVQTNLPLDTLVAKERVFMEGNNMQERVGWICADLPDLKYVLIHNHKPEVITWTGKEFRASYYPVKMVPAPRDTWSRVWTEMVLYRVKECFLSCGRGDITIEYVAFEEIVSAAGSTKV